MGCQPNGVYTNSFSYDTRRSNNLDGRGLRHCLASNRRPRSEETRPVRHARARLSCGVDWRGEGLRIGILRHMYEDDVR